VSVQLHLYQRPGQGNGYLGDLTTLMTNWQDTSKAVGGYLTAEGTINDGCDLAAFFNAHLGCVVRRQAYGLTAWEGVIYEMRLTTGGVEYTRSLAPERWHNRVKILYQMADGPKFADWTEDLTASAQYGRSDYIVTLGTATADQAVALRARHLQQYAWPRAWLSGGVSLNEPGGRLQDALTLSCAGFWATLNWRYATATIEDQAANCVTRMLALAELVTAGRVESNALTVRLDCTTPQRVGDLLEQVAEAGDAAGNIWQIGVYNDRQLIYEAAPTTARYTWRGGQLYDGGAVVAVPELLRPGFLLYNASAPGGAAPAGSTSSWADPRYGYVDQVSYDSGGTVRLSLYGFDSGLSQFERLIGNAGRLLDEQRRRMAAELEADAQKRERYYRNQWIRENHPDWPLEPGEERPPGAGGVW
jgi:hypothetical protein